MNPSAGRGVGVKTMLMLARCVVSQQPLLVLFPRILFFFRTTCLITDTSMANRRLASSMYASSAQKNVIDTDIGVGTISGLGTVSNSNAVRCPTSRDDSANPMQIFS